MTVRAPRARVLRAALPHLAATMPWGTLLGGCAIGLAVSVVGYRFAGPASDSAGLTAVVRAAFAPLVLAVAFLGADPHRRLVAALPAPAWLTAATHTALALPILAVTAALQLRLAAAELATGQRYTLVPAHLAWPALSGELAAAAALALAIASAVARTRWHELGGAIAAPVSLTLIAVTHATWADVTWRILLVGALAVAAAAWAQRDPWLRLRLPSAIDTLPSRSTTVPSGATTVPSGATTVPSGATTPPSPANAPPSATATHTAVPPKGVGK